MTYANGRAPDAALQIVDGLHTVPMIVPRVLALIGYAAGQGRVVRVAHWYGSYRTLAEQAKLSGTGNSGSTIPVAAPGFSTHGVYDVGRVDLVGADGFTYSAALLAWLVAVTPAFGLAREFGDRDPNHFKAVGDFTPAVPVRRRSPMFIGLNYNEANSHRGAKVIVDLVNFTYVYPDADQISMWEQQGGIWSDVSDAMWTRALVPRRQMTAPYPLPVPAAAADTAAIIAGVKAIIPTEFTITGEAKA